MGTLILWLCLATAAGVFGVMIYSIATFRAAAGLSSTTLRHRVLVEILWAVIPIVIIVGMAAPALRMLW